MLYNYDHLIAWCTSDTTSVGLVDLRTEQVYSNRHVKKSCNIPLQQLPVRVFELPPRGNNIALLYPYNGALLSQPTIEACKELVDTLVNRSGYIVDFVCYLNDDVDTSLGNEEELWCNVAKHGYLEVGQVSSFLWRPCSYLEQYIDRIEQLLLKENDTKDISTTYSALDLGCGSGRDALFLCKRDFDWNTVAVDHDPILLSKIQSALVRYGIESTSLRCENIDLEPVYVDPAKQDMDFTNRLSNDGQYSLVELELLISLQERLRSLSPSKHGFHFINVARYLYRPLLPIIDELVLPGGFLLFHTFMLPSKGKPKRPRYLLNYNELKLRFSRNFDIVEYQETVLEDSRPIQILLAMKKKNNK
ncbi:hypothetical protein SAMD00019534_000070 [Acytostelium subglobosum LB1]|uniref:hypothetical protein n=1 Tax=Acytostelium subglobosum LB1 TaxID=1410327 RepID=UPI000644A720|nr:hypothetical protein SAMD00019534_000070 [Acytostelium subglobosum LB1]GAM16832.1 hypothetical protein SAMD00019534_000070 [Acytostelium subglobosum LB1]|eukprot:XP_012758894.1 hypothetical protein SAMD00019534_000070 [Acytostelium subglobosum LB1]